MRKLFGVVLVVAMLLMVVSCGKSEDAKNDRFRDWGVRGERKVRPAPSFLDGYENEFGDRQKRPGGVAK
ncbi:hypothetical protein GMPD_15270 [Geomonas paludis]|uniref:Lipoprotein n=2 Tax=Geomonas paludis TaxID=2740185 RepID=A0A6V8MTW4_9BACT|nr:hypothetical protein GMPD_15270 [Geomonas paludis]